MGIAFCFLDDSAGVTALLGRPGRRPNDGVAVVYVGAGSGWQVAEFATAPT
ncbi:MAG: hypothetical protein ABI947_15015 [Chloroflexota bacterium]